MTDTLSLRERIAQALDVSEELSSAHYDDDYKRLIEAARDVVMPLIESALAEKDKRILTLEDDVTWLVEDDLFNAHAKLKAAEQAIREEREQVGIMVRGYEKLVAEKDAQLKAETQHVRDSARLVGQLTVKLDEKDAQITKANEMIARLMKENMKLRKEE